MENKILAVIAGTEITEKDLNSIRERSLIQIWEESNY